MPTIKQICYIELLDEMLNTTIHRTGHESIATIHWVEDGRRNESKQALISASVLLEGLMSCHSSLSGPVMSTLCIVTEFFFPKLFGVQMNTHAPLLGPPLQPGFKSWRQQKHPLPGNPKNSRRVPACGTRGWFGPSFQGVVAVVEPSGSWLANLRCSTIGCSRGSGVFSAGLAEISFLVKCHGRRSYPAIRGFFYLHIQYLCTTVFFYNRTLIMDCWV